MNELDIKRNIQTDPFFNNNPIGSVVKMAILNDFTIICDKSFQFSIGAFSSQDCDIIYPYNDKMRVREKDVFFVDYLYFEKDGDEFAEQILESKIPVRVIDVSRDLVKRTFFNENGEFFCIWRTDVFYKHELWKTFKTKIRFILKDENIAGLNNILYL